MPQHHHHGCHIVGVPHQQPSMCHREKPIHLHTIHKKPQMAQRQSKWTTPSIKNSLLRRCIAQLLSRHIVCKTVSWFRRVTVNIASQLNKTSALPNKTLWRTSYNKIKFIFTTQIQKHCISCLIKSRKYISFTESLLIVPLYLLSIYILLTKLNDISNSINILLKLKNQKLTMKYKMYNSWCPK